MIIVYEGITNWKGLRTQKGHYKVVTLLGFFPIYMKFTKF